MNLQHRLNAVFGGLSSSKESEATAAWTPSQQNIFRSGGENDHDDHNTLAEDALQLRREVLPGIAMDLVEEDAPDPTTNLKPSVAFCRQVDAEAENELEDVFAVHAAPEEPRPSKDTEVLDNNVYEHRVRLELSSNPSLLDQQRLAEPAAQAALPPLPSTATTATTTRGEERKDAGASQQADIDMEEDAGPTLAWQTPHSVGGKNSNGATNGSVDGGGGGRSNSSSLAATPSTSSQGRPIPTPSKSSLRKGSGGIKKRVSFTGLPPSPPPAWVPPHRRSSNFIPKISAAEAEQQRRQQQEDLLAEHLKKQQRIAGVSQQGGETSLPAPARGKVPDHVKNPQRYKRYDLGEEVVVGGGIAQLQSTNASAENGDDDGVQEEAMNNMADTTTVGAGAGAGRGSAVKPPLYNYKPQGGLAAALSGDKRTASSSSSSSAAAAAAAAAQTRPTTMSLSWDDEDALGQGNEQMMEGQTVSGGGGVARRQYRGMKSRGNVVNDDEGDNDNRNASEDMDIQTHI